MKMLTQVSLIMLMVVFGNEQYEMETSISEINSMMETVKRTYNLKPKKSVLFFSTGRAKIDMLLEKANMGEVQELSNTYYVHDANTDVAMFGCPIEEGTKPSTELISSYFITNVTIARTNEIKIGLVVQYYDRKLLKELFVTVSKLTTDLNKYKKNLFFIISYCYKRTKGELKKSTISALNTIVSTLEKENSPQQTITMVKEAIDDLNSSGKKFIFCASKYCDSEFSQINKLAFVEVSPKDFSDQWNISPASRRTIETWVSTAEKNLCSLLTKETEKLKSHADQRLKAETKYPELVQEYIQLIDYKMAFWSKLQLITHSELVQSVNDFFETYKFLRNDISIQTEIQKYLTLLDFYFYKELPTCLKKLATKYQLGDSSNEESANAGNQSNTIDQLVSKMNNLLATAKKSSNFNTSNSTMEITARNKVAKLLGYTSSQQLEKLNDNMKPYLQNLNQQFCTLTNNMGDIIRHYIEMQVTSNPSGLNGKIRPMSAKFATLIDSFGNKTMTYTEFNIIVQEVQPYVRRQKDHFILKKIMHKILVGHLFSHINEINLTKMSVCLLENIKQIKNTIVDPWSLWTIQVTDVINVAQQQSFENVYELMLGDTTNQLERLQQTAKKLKLEISTKNIKLAESDHLKITYLNNLVASRNIAYCPKEFKNQMIIKNDQITLTEVKTILDLHASMHQKRHLGSKRYPQGLIDCDKSLSSIQVFAFKKLVLDTNLTVVNASLTLMAPNWQVVGKPTITMHGADGEPFLEPAKSDGWRKVNGEAGRPGHPAGAFIGIGAKFENIDALTIRSEGGSGGNGQDGAPGTNGLDSPERIYVEESKLLIQIRVFYTIDKLSKCSDLMKYYDVKINSRILYIYGSEHPFNPKSPIPLMTLVRLDGKKQRIENIEVPADEATNGGPGGDGGPGGQGGSAGIVKFYNLNGPSPDVQIKYFNGPSGNCGSPGEGGKAGKKHSQLYCTLTRISSNKEDLCRRYPHERECIDGIFHRKLTPYVEGEKTNPGSPGGACTSSLSSTIPESATNDLISPLENFKLEAFEYLHSKEEDAELHQFLQDININLQLNSNYEIKNIIRAFMILEQRISSLVKSSLHQMQLFQWLQERIKKANNNEDTTTAFLSRTITTKLLVLRNNEQSDLMVNSRRQLQSIIDMLEEQAKANELIEIHKLKEGFSTTVARKIATGYLLVDSQIAKKIDKDMKSLEQKLVTFMKKVESKQTEIENTVDDMRRQQEQMRRMAILNAVFSVIKMVSKVVSLFGPIGAMVGGISETLADMGTTFMNNEIGEAMALNVETLNEKFESMMEEEDEVEDEHEVVEKEAEIAKNELEKETDNPVATKAAEELDDSLKEIKSEKDKKQPNMSKIKKAKQSICKTVQNMKNVDDKTIEKVTGRFTAGIDVASIGLDAYKQFGQSVSEDEQLTQQINEGMAAAENLKKFRAVIKDTVQPVLRTMSADFQRAIKELRRDGKATLMIKNWNIRSVLGEMKIKLREMLIAIDDMDVRDSVAGYLDLLEDTMNTLVKVYDQVETFKDQKQLVQFIADVNMARTKSQNTHIPLEPEALQLYSVIKKNSMEMEYNVFMRQFLQAVFPMAIYYIGDMNILPPNFHDNSMLFDHYVTTAKELQKRLNQLDNVVNNHIDTHLISSKFESTDSSEIKPFFVWKYNEHNKTIRQLLNGEEVVLYADIHKSFMDLSRHRRDAIKFKDISLNFRAVDSSNQPTLKKLLDDVSIEMTHMGNSYYKCADKFYMFSSQPQKLIISYYNKCKENIIQTAVVKKLTDGEASLSPYAFWKVRIATENKNVFSQLAKVEAIDVELQGTGVYLRSDRKQDCEHLKITEFYEKHEVSNFGNELELLKLDAKGVSLENTIVDFFELNE